MRIKIVSFNIHKGHSSLKQEYTLETIRQLLKDLSPDIICLQEIHGIHPKNYENSLSPLEQIADTDWPHFKHGVNSIYSSNHHGNAILSKFPIVKSDNTSISTNRLERRGVLHVQVKVNQEINIDLFCTHLNLFPSGQYKQIVQIKKLISEKRNSPSYILAGDFNDWSGMCSRLLRQELHPVQSYKSFPSLFPLLKLDRIYYQGLDLKESSVSTKFRGCSDHLPIIAEFNIPKGPIV